MDSDNLSLQHLLQASADGNENAFADLYARTSPKLYALLLRILKTRDLAEDALQECYVRIWQNAERYDAARGAPMAWLATIARYRALDMLRARKPDSSLDAADDSPVDEIEAPVDGPEEYALSSEGVSRLDSCMQGLAPEQRNIVLMAYYQGYTHTEISQRMNTAIGTVKSWLYRGLTKLRDCLGTD